MYKVESNLSNKLLSLTPVLAFVEIRFLISRLIQARVAFKQSVTTFYFQNHTVLVAAWFLWL